MPVQRKSYGPWRIAASSSPPVVACRIAGSRSVVTLGLQARATRTFVRCRAALLLLRCRCIGLRCRPAIPVALGDAADHRTFRRGVADIVATDRTDRRARSSALG